MIHRLLPLLVPIVLAAWTPAGAAPVPALQGALPSVPAPDGILWPPAELVSSAAGGERGEFGGAVSIDVDSGTGAAWALVGAPRASRGGRVLVHRRVGGRTCRWIAQGQPLVDPGRLRPGSQFGAAVAVEGSIAAAGAPRSGGVGAVLVRRLGKQGPLGRTVELRPHASEGARAFGAALALARGSDGRARLAIGAPEASVTVQGGGALELAGEVHVYVLTGRFDWRLERVLRAPTPRFAARFGASLCFLGDRLVVGAPGDDRAGPGAGRVVVFAGAGSPVLGPVLEIGPPGVPASAAGARYGAAVSALGGDCFAVGAPGLGAAEVAAVTDSGGLTHRQLLAGSALDGFASALAGSERALHVGEPLAGPGATGRVAVFVRASGQWHRAGSLHPASADVQGEFGAAVAADSDLLLVGEPGDGGPCPAASPGCGAGGAAAFSDSARRGPRGRRS